jgi:hypothetical protein
MLELADEDGNPISPNEYLDLCIKEQEGFSQKISEKNRIRGLIKSFFKVSVWVFRYISNSCSKGIVLL